MPSAPHYYYFKATAYSKPRVTAPRSRLWLSRVFFISGLVTLIYVVYPLINFQLGVSRQFAQNKFLSPSGSSVASASTLTETDYTVINNWFPGLQSGKAATGDGIVEYKLSIPKLKIADATVALTGENLAKGLVHYGGTTLPGHAGNGVIFGHSILPQFFNPKNYMTIFSTLHNLEKGDQILVTYDEITYQYQVIDIFEVSPKDISVLDQTYDDKYLTLITCTPPGTYLRRLIVKAKLVPHYGNI